MQGSSIFPQNRFNQPVTFAQKVTAQSGIQFTLGPVSSGWVFTATDSLGNGQWQAPSGSIADVVASGINVFTNTNIFSGVLVAKSGIQFSVGSPVSGYVWTANGPAGSGQWQAPSGSIGDITASGANVFSGLNTFNGNVVFNSGVTFNGPRLLAVTTVTGGAYTPLASDDVIEFQVATGFSGQMNLPASFAVGTSFGIKDGTGNATSFPIVISGFPNIDGIATYTIDQGWGSISVYRGAGGWRII